MIGTIIVDPTERIVGRGACLFHGEFCMPIVCLEPRCRVSTPKV